MCYGVFAMDGHPHCNTQSPPSPVRPGLPSIARRDAGPAGEAWCLDCSGRYVPLATGSKRTCERACTSHGNRYRHNCTILSTTPPKNAPAPSPAPKGWGSTD